MNFRARMWFLLWTWLLALFLLADARVIFFIYHHGRFAGGVWQALFYGLRFDIVAATALNALFIFLTAFPVSFFHFKGFRFFMKTIFMLANGLGLLGNFVDTAYFPYTLRRSTPDAVAFFLEKNDAGTLLPVFLADFWHLALVFVAYLFLLGWLYNLIQRHFLFPYHKEENNLKRIAVKSFALVIVIGLSVLGIRGGTQLIPLSIIDAGNFVHARYVPLVLNTPFCFIKSGELYTLDEKQYMTEAEAERLVNPEKKYSYADSEFVQRNVVYIIVESLSKEYTGLGGRKSYTPFLDSLFEHGLVFTNAFANGKRSIEGIPAIVASMPSFQYDYISTVYCNNDIASIASVLKNKGYRSSFFHGGSNGTMNFDGFCATAAYERYFGRSEYDNEEDYDGDWGVWDEPFLLRMAAELGKEKEPFVSTVFTLSSHHPYRVPEKYRGRFPEGSLPIHRCIGYADHSLQKFFAAASRQSWFRNTLFVITADHTGNSEDPFYSNSVGNYQVPLCFYLPDNSLRDRDSGVAQQIDILPTTLALLRYNKLFFAFGNNLVDPALRGKRWAINYYNICYQFFTDDQLLHFDGFRPLALYNYKGDSLLSANLLPGGNVQQALRMAQACIQQYNNRLIQNRTSVP